MFRRVLINILLATLLPGLSIAVDRRCGVDTDLSGTVDTLCPEPDKDGDGYTSDGSLGRAGTTNTDCDDTNFFIRPGISYKGPCSAGEFKTCNANGTTSACAALSTFTCDSGGGETYWIDDDETDCAGTGGYADEEDWRCTSDTGMSNYHAPVAGDCYVYRAGTYSSMWSSNTRHIYFNNKDGTSADNITFIAAPGESWWEAGAGNGVLIDGGSTSPTEVELMKFSLSDYINVAGFEMTSGASGYNSIGIHYEGGLTGGNAYNNYIHDLHGECGSANCSGISVRVSAVGNEIQYNFFDDIYELGETNNENTADLTFMDADDFKASFNVFVSSDGYGYGVKVKHGEIGGVGAEIYQNIFADKVYRAPIGVAGMPHTRVRYNYIYNPNAEAVTVTEYSSTNDDYSDILIERNTIVNTNINCWLLNPNNDQTTAGSPSVTVQDNICVSDHSGTWASSGDNNSEVRVQHYGSDALYSHFITGARVIIENNCVYKSTGDAFQGTIFGNNDTTSSGNVYNTWSAWQTAGWDTGGSNENPTLDSYGRATSTNCSDAGWLLTSEESGGGGGGSATFSARAVRRTNRGRR